jgi:hypothetical protein
LRVPGYGADLEIGGAGAIASIFADGQEGSGPEEESEDDDH